MELLAELEGTHSGGGSGLGRKGTGAAGPESDAGQLSFFESRHPVVDRLRALDPDRMTPLEALNVLHALRAAVAEGQ